MEVPKSLTKPAEIMHFECAFRRREATLVILDLSGFCTQGDRY